MNPDGKIKDMPMKEINDFIALSLRGKLTGFIYRRTKKQLARKSKFKVDVISWHCGKYGEILHLGFCGLVRHNEIDGLYEKLFGVPRSNGAVQNGTGKYSAERLNKAIECISASLAERQKSGLKETGAPYPEAAVSLLSAYCFQLRAAAHGRLPRVFIIISAYFIFMNILPKNFISL